MNKPLRIALIILALIIASVVYLLASDDTEQAKQDMLDKTPSSVMDADEPLATQDNSTAANGAYVDYKDGIVATTSGTKLLFFHAPWCPQCRDLEASIKKEGVPDGVTIIKVDYDSSRDLRQKYGVTLQTTIVRIDDSGNLVKKFVAYDDPSIGAIKNNLL